MLTKHVEGEGERAALKEAIENNVASAEAAPEAALPMLL